MTEDDVRHVLLTRAYELGPPTPAWTQEDRRWATDAAAEHGTDLRPDSGPDSRTNVRPGTPSGSGAYSGPVAEPAFDDVRIAARARIATERLTRRSSVARRMLAATQWHPWITPAIAGAALLLGFTLDAVSAGQRINILAPPILAILVWNLCVYAWLLIARLRRGPSRGGQHEGARDTRPPGRDDGPLRTLLRRVAFRFRLDSDDDGRGEERPVAEFTRSWTEAAGPLMLARVAASFHLGAAAFAAGALLGLYLRGLAFEYRAGWESTFLGVDSVHAIVHAVLTPASLLTGIALPDLGRLAALRFPASTGENAAGWIHLYAVTVLIAVLIPRLVLFARSALRAARLRDVLPLPLHETYYRNLQRVQTGSAATIVVLPYSTTPRHEGTALKRLLQAVFGDNVQLLVLPSIALGDEDEAIAALDRELIGRSNHALLLYSLSATPERETHGDFARQLRRATPHTHWTTLIDESAFRERFADQPERLATRREAWNRMLREIGLDAPAFAYIDRSLDAHDEGARQDMRALRRAVDESAHGRGLETGVSA